MEREKNIKINIRITHIPIIYFSLFFVFSFLFCSLSNDNIVGSDKDTEIENLSFLVDSTYSDTTGIKLVAKGRVTNDGNHTITSPWYVEAQFYTDSSFTTKLGGNYDRINVPLSKGQSTFWKIDFSTSTVNVLDYPNFAIHDIRGIYK